jgi:hypothetical protein
MLENTRLRYFALTVVALLVSGVVVPTSAHAEETGSMGPDVTVHYLPNATYWGSDGSIHAYSVGTTSCNQGTEPLAWCDETSGCAPGDTETDHPVIAQNVYRLKDGRFEQIGMSWLKHGFFALQNSDPGCGNGSCDPAPFAPDQLGVGCTDPYGAGLNGNRPLGRRSTTNPTTGEHPTRPPNGGTGNIAERIQIEAADIDPAQNPGALYWVEGHYIAPDDATEGNGLNNASYRPASFDGGFQISLSGDIVRELPAIFAWQQIDPEVEILTVDVPDSRPVQRFYAARRITPGPPGTWHYEYAIHNLNSDRAARLLRIEFPSEVTITNAGFHDVDHHSGEPYDTADWTIDIGMSPNTIEWYTDEFTTDEDANALRWGTTFTFWFDADQPSAGVTHTLELFKPGIPVAVDIPLDGPVGVFSDDFESGDTSAWSETTEP